MISYSVGQTEFIVQQRNCTTQVWNVAKKKNNINNWSIDNRLLFSKLLHCSAFFQLTLLWYHILMIFYNSWKINENSRWDKQSEHLNSHNHIGMVKNCNVNGSAKTTCKPQHGQNCSYAVRCDQLMISQKEVNCKKSIQSHGGYSKKWGWSQQKRREMMKCENTGAKDIEIVVFTCHHFKHRCVDNTEC